MSEPVRLELSAMGAVRPPAEAALAAATRREAQGFDAIWWADHLLHWFPLSIWTPDLVPQAAAGQRSPHVWFDPVPVVAAAAGVTTGIRLGIGVTDLVRRHPVSVAQSALTLDHLSRRPLHAGRRRGRGAEPRPLRDDQRAPPGTARRGPRPDAAADGRPGSDRLRRRSLPGAPGLPGAGAPAVRPARRSGWRRTARAASPLTGRRADGWLPLATDPAEYARMLAAVRSAAARAGRAEDAVTPGLYARIVVAETREAALAAIDGSLLMRFIALTRPAEAFAAHGAVHPLGEGAFGLTSFLPTTYGRAEALALAEAVPAAVVRDTVIHGTPDDIARDGGALRRRGRPARAADQHDPARRPWPRRRQRGAAGRRGVRAARRDRRPRVSRARTGIAAAVAAAALAAVAAPARSGRRARVTVEGWHPRVLAFSGDRLLWTEAATVRVDPARIAGSPAGARRFDYYRAEVFRARLDRASRRFTGEIPRRPSSIRTSIAAMAPGTLSPDRRRGLRDGAGVAPLRASGGLVLRRGRRGGGDRERRPRGRPGDRGARPGPAPPCGSPS